MAFLETKFEKGRGIDTIFPTNTPVEFAKGNDGPVPSLSAKLASKFFERFSKRLKPIMKVRDAMDKVYSKGYFENHYPDTDKKLKRLLHEEAKIAESRLNATDHDDENETENRGVVIQINLGGLLGG